MKRRVVALGIAVLMVPGLSGCWSGFNAATTVQSASGDGTQVDAEGITIDSATIVAGDPGSGKAAFLATVFNPTRQPDEVLAITADGVRAEISPSPIEVLPLKSVAIQNGKTGTVTEPAASANFLAFEAKTGTYVDVVMTFRTAAEQRFTALVVPPSGFYAEAAPDGTTPIPLKVNDEVHGGETGGEGAEAGATGAETGAPMPEMTPEPMASQ